MEIKTFRAATLQEALQQIRESMGADACVLATRELRKSRLGLFSSTLIEVEASCESPVDGGFQTMDRLPQQTTLGDTDSSHPKLNTPLANTHTTTSEDEAMAPESHLGGGRSWRASTPAGDPQAETSGLGSTLTSAMVQVLSSMLKAGIEPRLAKSLMTESCESLTDAQCHQEQFIRTRLHAVVTDRLHTRAEPQMIKGTQRVIALVGSTGVGKTTTLAKLASAYRLESGCQVGLLTVDTYRFGAVDQLLQYAEAMSAPLEVVSSPDQIAGALERLQFCEVVLLDTAGRSPTDTEHVSRLAESLSAVRPEAVHLVISATSSQSHLNASLDRFADINPTSLIVTKLDEADSLGQCLGFLCDCGLPISYLAHGQRVPQDIVSPTANQLTEMVLSPAANISTSTFA